jgi:hypothetical protein
MVVAVKSDIFCNVIPFSLVAVIRNVRELLTRLNDNKQQRTILSPSSWNFQSY